MWKAERALLCATSRGKLGRSRLLPDRVAFLLNILPKRNNIAGMLIVTGQCIVENEGTIYAGVIFSYPPAWINTRNH
jgi:hypothetical protein